ncbi:MAG: ribonuclease HII, partial [Ruaniaceae bacterium]|nr:ribonuclease HII [Ruaniaceae bacterium]
MILPTREAETALLAEFPIVVGIDEVGRGALAGPVCVGAAIVDRSTGDFPSGLRDSKLLTAPARDAIVGAATLWVTDSAVGSASAAEIDSLGIVAALRLAAVRALEMLHNPHGAAAILDGTHNWLASDIFGPCPVERVDVMPKADARCAVVAAASVIAKVYRDRLMCELPDPGYGFGQH